jgi:hypothetical protein
MGKNRTRAATQNNARTTTTTGGGKRKAASKARSDATKVAKLAEIARRMDRATTHLPVGFTPMEVSQLQATGTIPRDMERVSKFIRKPDSQRRPPNTRKMGPIERIQRAIDMNKKSLSVVAKLAFTEAKPYLEDGLRVSNKHRVVGKDFMGIPELTEAVMNHTFKGVKGFELTQGSALLYRVSSALLKNTKTDNGYFPRPTGGEYEFAKVSHFFTKSVSVRSASFYGSSYFPHDFAKRSILFPLSKNDRIQKFLESQTRVWNTNDPVKEEICQAILSISTDTDQIKYPNRPTSKSVYTRDYEIILNEVIGEAVFDHDKAVLRIEIHRKMATAVPTTIHNEPGSRVIPLFEEAIIYFQQLENTEYRNTESCLVLSSTPVVSDRLAHMHVFGDNAFTLLLPDALKYSGDRHQKSMTNVGIVLGRLDRVERLTQLIDTDRSDIEEDFKFLIKKPDNTDRKPVTDLLKKVVNDKKMADLKAARTEDARNTIKQNQERNTSTEQSNLLSNSFLSNQIKKATVITESKHMPLIQHWIVSATFSFIAIQIEGTSLSYCFIQSFSPANWSEVGNETIVNVPAIIAPQDMITRRLWSRPRTATPSIVTSSEKEMVLQDIDPDEINVGVYPFDSLPKNPGTAGGKGASSVPKVGDTESWALPPSSQAARNRRNAAVDGWKTRSAKAMFQSSLPPELELELELL